MKPRLSKKIQRILKFIPGKGPSLTADIFCFIEYVTRVEFLISSVSSLPPRVLEPELFEMIWSLLKKKHLKK